MSTQSNESLIVKHSIVLAGHRTSVSLEDEFWNALKDIAASRHTAINELVAQLNAKREQRNLSSAIRLFVLDFYRSPLPPKPTDEAVNGHTVP